MKGKVKTMENINNTTPEFINEVRLNCACIAIGNGGSQVGLSMHKNGFETILINTSARDLSNDVVTSAIQSFIIEDSNNQGRGAGRNREIAKKLYADWSQQRKLFSNDFFNEFVRDRDVIFILSSTGGGTGSGITPTFAFQLSKKYPNKAIIIVGIMPRLSESINSQKNNVEFWNEIDSLNKNGVTLPYMAFDLEKLGYMKTDEAYAKIAADVTDAAGVIAGNMSMLTPYGMIDERNMLTMISTGGLMSVYTNNKVKMTEIANNGIQDVIINNMKYSSSVNTQRDKVSKYYGLFLEVDDQIDDPVKQASYDKLFSVCGEPFEIFVNYGITDKPIGKFGLIVSGQSMPYDRIKESIERVKAFEIAQKEKAYSISEDAFSLKGITGNNQINKILGSASSEPSTDNIEELPDFLKSSI